MQPDPLPLREHALVVLTCEPPSPRLSRGDIGTVVFVYPDAAGVEVEFIDGGGHTIAVETLAASDVRAVAANEILHARPLPV